MVIWIDGGETAQEFIVSIRERDIIEEYRVNLTRKKFYKVRDFIDDKIWGAVIRIINANEHELIGRYKIVPDPLLPWNSNWIQAPFQAGEVPLLETN